ncbi:MAG: insulinase family protein [Rhodothermales bacterium]|nr:insulinase family protein [Rhodothermales bacterium]
MMENSTPDYFRKTTLPNGVRIVSEHIPSVRSISAGVWVAVGSRDEEDGEAGICHFIEHMVFKGTRKRRMHHIAQRLENVGGYLNAFTAKEYTCYYARALDEHLGRAIDTVCDLILSPEFPVREIDREKDVVIEEMKMYLDTPDDHVFDILEEALFAGHPMGRPVIGTESSVRSFDREKLIDFSNRHYTPNRIVVALAGNVDHDRAVRLIEKEFAVSDRKPGTRTPRPITPFKPSSVTRERPIQQAHLVLGTRGYDVHDPRRVALSVYNTILGGGMSSRLNQNIRERYGYCYSIYSFVNMHSDTGDLGVYMGTDASKVDRAEKLIRRELDKLRQKPVGPKVIDRARSQVKGSIMLGLESMGSRMMRIGRQELYYGRYYSLDEILEMVDAIEPEDVLDVARDVARDDRFSVVRLLPSSKTNTNQQT